MEFVILLFGPAERAGRLHVEPRLCGVRRPQHKGKVERSIRYLRDRFFAGRVIHSIEQGNLASLVSHRTKETKEETK